MLRVEHEEQAVNGAGVGHSGDRGHLLDPEGVGTVHGLVLDALVNRAVVYNAFLIEIGAAEGVSKVVAIYYLLQVDIVKLIQRVLRVTHYYVP